MIKGLIIILNTLLKMSDRMKQVLVVRTDLKMPRGKEDAQCSHASQAFMVDTYLNGGKPTKEAVEWYATNQTKVVVCVRSEKELIDIFREAKNKGLETHMVRDAGHTVFSEPTNTVVAIGPNKESQINKITGGLRLR